MAASKILFSDALRAMRLRKGMTQSALAEKVGVTTVAIAVFEKDERVPERDLILKIIKALELYTEDADLLLGLANMSPLSPSESRDLGYDAGPIVAAGDLLPGDKIDVPFWGRAPGKITTYINYDDGIKELKVQFKDVQNAIEELGKRAANPISTPQSGDELSIKEQIEILGKNFKDLQASSQALTAPVEMPSREAMAVSLVPSHLLERLEEYRGEESAWFSWFGVFVGSVIGVLINVVTGGELTKEAWILIGAFVIMSLLCGGFGWMAKSRGGKLRDKLFPNKKMS